MAGVQERKQMLLDDPDLSKVEEHRVFCNRCDKWLKLDETKLYAASVWRCHKNTKSHNARAPNLSASAPPPPKSEGASVATGRQNASASASLPLSSKERPESSSKASLSRRVSSGDHSRLRSFDATLSTASAPVPQSLPRLKLKVPGSARSDPAPISAPASGATTSVPRSASTSNGAAPASSTSFVPGVSKSRPSVRIVQTPASSQPASSRSNVSQKSMLPPATSPSTLKLASHPLSYSTQSLPSSQLTNQSHSQPTSSSNSRPRVRSASLSGKNREVPSTIASGSGTSLPPPERLSPHRQASYKALISEQYIGTLEPFRAFCTLCNRWVDLSSRTPYSYGVWKGHVRKSEKHNRLQSGNAEDEYDTGSEHSPEESGMHHTSDNAAPAEKTLVGTGTNGVPASSTSVSRTESEDAPGSNGINGKPPALPESPVDYHHLTGHTAFDSQHTPTPTHKYESSPSAATPNPFALKATTEDSFGPRRKGAVAGQSKGSQVSLLEGDDMPVLTESSEEEAPSSSQVPQKPAVIAALEKRRDMMLADPDAAIVEARRVQCRLCERWIKGSNTQEYSSHHWLKHKNKCARARAREGDRWSETVEARKARLEEDPDVATLEPHRALCRLCNKWVKLCGRSRYSASHWLQHKKKCPAVQSQVGPGMAAQGEGLADEAETSEVAVTAQSVDEKQPYPKQPVQASTVESRRAILLADPDILQLFPDRVQCRPCNRWIKLSMPVEYSPGHWLTHKECCPGQASDSTSKLQAALEVRKKTLEEDPYVAELEPHRVHCGMCNSWVKLRTDCSYSLGKWELHKKRCGQQPRGVKVGSSVDVESAAKELEDLTNGLEDFGDDDREAMDVENALSGMEGDLNKDCGVPNTVGEAVPPSSPHEGIENHDAEGGRQRHHNNGVHETDGDGDIEMPGPQPVSNGDMAHDDADDEAEDGGQGDSSSRQQITSAAAEEEATQARRQELLHDRDVAEVGPQHVLCWRCQSWVLLEGPSAYMLGNWHAHKKECSRGTRNTDAPMQDISHGLAPQPSSRHKPAIGKAPSRPIRPLPKVKNKGVASKRPRSPMTLPPVPSRPRWPDEDERKQQFIDDPDVQRVEPHRLLCKHCNCWIRLHPIIRYSQSIWPQHKASCKQVLVLVPSDAKVRAKSEKEDARQRLLEEDPYATDVGPHRVTCKACGTNIRLDTTYKYEGSHWRAHRSRCARIPFHERLPKKRRITEQPVPEPVAVAYSSDSSDSDASSAPRPRPTSFFTDPLIIRPTEMFKRRSRVTAPSASELAAIATAKAKAESGLAAHLERLAAQLDVSDRLMTIIQSAGDGMTSEELAQQRKAAVKPTAVEDTDSVEDAAAPSTPRPSPSPEPEMWVPSKRTREEEEEFDTFFFQRPLPPTPPRSTSKVRVCKLGKEALQVVD